MANKKQGDDAGNLTITRIFNARREQLWKAWTEPEIYMKWWGPRGYTSPVARIDLVIGGKYVSCMRPPYGKDVWSAGTYKEIVKPKLLVMTDSFSDKDGNAVPASKYGMLGDWPLELQITVSFEERDGKTKMTLHHEGFPDRQNAEMAKAGWNQSFDKLDEYLETGQVKVPKTTFFAEPGKQEITLTRIFDAPRERVFKMVTDPKLIPRWWGPKRFTTVVDKMDVRPGGMWRFVQKDAKGSEYAFHGIYHEVKPPERLVYTFEFEGMPGHVMLETVRFEDIDGKTKMSDKTVFQSVDDRDGMVLADMESGARESNERFAELVEKRT